MYHIIMLFGDPLEVEKLEYVPAHRQGSHVLVAIHDESIHLESTGECSSMG